jgi:hypothetical protein
MQKMQDDIDAQVERFKVGLPIALAKMALKHYPFVFTFFQDRELTRTQNSGRVRRYPSRFSNSFSNRKCQQY